jgi:hypothetical protein
VKRQQYHRDNNELAEFSIHWENLNKPRTGDVYEKDSDENDSNQNNSVRGRDGGGV